MGKMSEQETEPEFCVILSELDNTYNTVPTSDVVNSGVGDLAVGDSVCFFWNTEKHSGPIQHMGDDFGSCNKLAKTLTAQMKSALIRQQSFHADRPRHSKVLGLERIRKRSADAQSSESSKKSKLTKKALQADRKQRRELEEGCEILRLTQADTELDSTMEMEHSGTSEVSSATSVSSDDRSPDAKPNSSNKAAQEMLKEKIKRLSAQLAENISKKNIATYTSPAITPKSNTNSYASSSPQNSGAGSKVQAKPTATSTPKSYSLYLAKGSQFMGQMLLFNVSTDDTKELLGADGRKSGIHCDRIVFDCAESSASATSAARRLLAGVFTTEAIVSCSITGLPPRGKGRQAYSDVSVIKSHLCPKAVRAIIDQALEWQRLKYLRPKRDASSVRTAMSIKLCELRKGLNESALVFNN